jgi:hypothetical protein
MSSARSVAMRTTTTGWPGYLNGASVFRGSLVRIDITSPQELASYLLNSEHQSSIEAKLVDLLSNAEVLHGWILDYEIGVDDGHVGVSSWHVFVFGCLSTFVVPSHLLQVASILVDAIALGDLVLAGTQRVRSSLLAGVWPCGHQAAGCLSVVAVVWRCRC